MCSCSRLPAQGVLVAVTNRMVFTSFYVNGHIIVALAYVMLAAGAWLLAERAAPRGAPAAMVIAASAAFVTRPDAIVALALVLGALALQAEIPARTRAATVLASGLAALVWSASVALEFRAAGAAVTTASLASIAAAVALCIAAALALVPLAARLQRYLLLAVEALLWAVVVVLAMRTEGVMGVSVQATWENVVGNAGGWYPMLPGVAALLGVAIVVLRMPRARVMRFAVTTFVPLGLILAAAREGAYRVGAGDSLNRSWSHVFALAVIVLAVLIVAGRPRWERRVRRDSADPPDGAERADAVERAVGAERA